jgi:hypothetical protein
MIPDHHSTPLLRLNRGPPTDSATTLTRPTLAHPDQASQPDNAKPRHPGTEHLTISPVARLNHRPQADPDIPPYASHTPHPPHNPPLTTVPRY